MDLISNLTLENFRQAYYRSEPFPQLSLEEWLARDRPRADDLIRHHTLRLLQEAGAPGDHAELMMKGEAFIQGLAVRGR
jgi:hypothetical protein